MCYLAAETGVGILRFAIIDTFYYVGYCVFHLPQEKSGQNARLSCAHPRERSCRSSACDFSLIVLAAALLYAAVLLAIDLWRQKREKV